MLKIDWHELLEREPFDPEFGNTPHIVELSSHESQPNHTEQLYYDIRTQMFYRRIRVYRRIALGESTFTWYRGAIHF